ncbi:MAG: hypothetical protein M0C28_17695 [Candidatus Moduliflexus flocculans]|nr:hypothetical protein [Candidatus Moduliflexus flocculans]
MTADGTVTTILASEPYMSAYAFGVDYRFLGEIRIPGGAPTTAGEEYGHSDVVAGYLEPRSRTEQTQYLMSVGGELKQR